MSTSPRRDLGVFDLKEEDEIADTASEKRLNKFESPNDPSVLKDEFTDVSQADKVSVKDVGCIPCNDVDVVGGNYISVKGVSDPPPGSSEGTFDYEEVSELEAAQQSNSIRNGNHPRLMIDIHKYNGSDEPETKDTSGGVPSPEMSHIDCSPSVSSSSKGSVDVNSEANEYMNESTLSSPVSDIAENVSLNGLKNCIGSSDMDDTNMEVVVHPDYAIYRDNYYLAPELTFSSCCIKIDGSSACVKQGVSNLDWAIDDVIDIKCQLFQSNGTVIIKIRVISSNAGHLNNVNRTSGIEELKIVGVDSNWSLKHKQITSLNVKYLAIWNSILDTDMEGDEYDLHGPKCYLPNFDEPFSEVVYPKGDPDAVSLSKRDVDLLLPDTFINDTIIDFYIKYLKNQIKEEEKHRFHFFNSFFFRKLADMDKNPSSASDGKAAFLRVRKWTRKVNLFKKDYIFIPVNFNLHWSLIVICHIGEVVTFNDEDLDKSCKVPCILHMDSIKGSHSGLKNIVQSYLWEEWKERQKDEWDEDLSSRFFNMRFLPLALPQQENSYDCGLFLLHYLELFLAEAPVNFNPFKLTKFSNFLNVDWFPPAEAFLKRTLIQRLIFELLENCSHHYLENNESRADDQFLGEGLSSGINGESTTSHAGQGIEITLLSASSSLDPHSGMVVRELFEPGATAGELLGQCQSFDHRSSDYRLSGSIFPIEEDTEIGEQFMYLTTDANFQQVAEIAPQTCEMPHLSRGCGADGPEIPIQAEHDKVESSRDTSGCASDDADDKGRGVKVGRDSSDCASDDSDVGFIENGPLGNEAGSSEEAEQGEKNCSSMENPESLTGMTGSATNNLPISTVVGSSQDNDTICHGNKNGVLDLYQVSEDVDGVTCDEVQMTDGMAPDFCEEQGAKRRRLMPVECDSDSFLES